MTTMAEFKAARRRERAIARTAYKAREKELNKQYVAHERAKYDALATAQEIMEEAYKVALLKVTGAGAVRERQITFLEDHWGLMLGELQQAMQKCNQNANVGQVIVNKILREEFPYFNKGGKQ